jgi:hypothetical protein
MTTNTHLSRSALLTLALWLSAGLCQLQIIPPAGAEESPASTLTDGLVGYWALDDDAGSFASDRSGNGNHGTLSSGNIPLWQPSGGKINGALLFDGNGGYVNCGNDPDFNLSDGLTVTAWIKVNAFTKDWQAIVTKGDSAWRIHRYSNTNFIDFACTGLMGGNYDWGSTVWGSTSVNDGQWHHVAGVYDYSASRVYLYVDGSTDGPNSVRIGYGDISTNGFNVCIGENAQMRGRYWNGLIDDVRIYPIALTATQILSMANLKPPSISMVAHWRLNESTGTIANDSSGNSHTGILQYSNPTWEPGKMGGALFFHGNPDHVNCGNNPIFNIIDHLSVAAWVNISTVPSDWTGIITKGDSAWRLSTYLNQNRFHFAVTGPPNYWSINGNTVIPAGQWHHVCGTYDGAFIRLYIDAIEDSASPVAYSGSIATSPHNVWLSGNSERAGREFYGLIDEVSVWNRPLNTSEINWLVNDGVGHAVWTPTDIYVDDNAPGDPAPGNPDISDPYENGTWEHPLDSIQEAIDIAEPGATVTVLDGTYTGIGNRNIIFRGTALTLRSRNGPANCIIDCQQLGTGFEFSSEEWTDSVVDGFTIINGYDEDQGKGGGGFYCYYSSPTINNCIITANKAWRGGAIFCYFAGPTITNCTITANEALYDEGGGICCWYGSPTITNCTISRNISAYGAAGLSCYYSSPTIENCSISHNSPEGIRIDDTAAILGTVQVNSNSLVGNGVLEMWAYATLETSDCNLSCNITALVGNVTILVPFGKELTIENNAGVNLYSIGGNGTLQCNGLLRVKDNAELIYTNLNVTRASFENNAVISNNIITTSALAPCGQLLVKDTASVFYNDIYANGDRYLDFVPACLLAHQNVFGNRIFVTLHTNKKLPVLFELRGKDFFCSPPCPPGLFPLASVPPFSRNTWTIEQLELTEGAKVTLTNRVDFQPPCNEGGEYEVAYVKRLVLGPNSVLDTAFNRLYYETIEKHPTAKVKNTRLLGFSLGKIDFDDEEQFATQIVHNNFIDIDPVPPDTTRIQVERVEGLSPDPTGMMLMRNLRDIDPASPTYGDIINARTKALFAACTEEEITIRFKYLFTTAEPGVELVVYLTDVPELLPYNDPMRDYHYIEVARIPAPPSGRPGSAGSGRFGVFQKTVSTEEMNFSEGTRIEAELIEPQQQGFHFFSGIDTTLESAPPPGASAFLDSWSAEVHCAGICLDLTGDNFVDEIDFLTVICGCGCASELLPDGTGDYVCFEGPFGSDGYIDSYDVTGWDWTLNSDNRKNLCDGIPLSEGMETASLKAGNLNASGGTAPLGNPPGDFNDLLIAGKMGTSDGPTKLKDRLYVFNSNAQYVRSLSPATDRSNIKIVRDPNGQLYEINAEAGVRRLDTLHTTIIPRGQTTYAKEPRYNKSATIYVGIKGEGASAVGRPILDAAFDANGYAYVVPVVVNPDGNEPYAAAAKLQLLSSGSPPYNVVKLYDDPPLPGDNQYRNNLREIEIDSAGNLYVINAHTLNESDILWRYKPNGTKERLELAEPDVNLPDPIGMYMSNATDMLYLASAQYNSEDYSSSIVYGFSTTGTLTLTRSITITNMQLATSITEDPVTGSLWVVGFNMDIPEYPDPTQPPFYYPRLAKVPLGSNNVQAQSLSGDHDLAMPLSVLWTKTANCGGADINKSNRVDFYDFALFTGRWRNSNCAPPAWCSGADLNNNKTVELADLAVIAQHWLQTGCLD